MHDHAHRQREPPTTQSHHQQSKAPGCATTDQAFAERTSFLRPMRRRGNGLADHLCTYGGPGADEVSVTIASASDQRMILRRGYALDRSNGLHATWTFLAVLSGLGGAMVWWFDVDRVALPSSVSAPWRSDRFSSQVTHGSPVSRNCFKGGF